MYNNIVRMDIYKINFSKSVFMYHTGFWNCIQFIFSNCIQVKNITYLYVACDQNKNVILRITYILSKNVNYGG